MRVEPVTTVIDDLDAPPADAADAYLRLHLLSHRLVRPHDVNLDGVFGVLPNVAWTSLGPVDVEQARARAPARAAPPGGHLEVFGVDKFPRMTDYVVPDRRAHRRRRPRPPRRAPRARARRSCTRAS